MPRRKAAAIKETTVTAPAENAKQAVEAAGPASDVTGYDPEKHITINGKVYDRDAFSPEHVQQISLINFADQQLASQDQNLKIAKLGRDALVSELLDAIKDVPFVGPIEA